MAGPVGRFTTSLLPMTERADLHVDDGGEPGFWQPGRLANFLDANRDNTELAGRPAFAPNRSRPSGPRFPSGWRTCWRPQRSPLLDDFLERCFLRWRQSDRSWHCPSPTGDLGSPLAGEKGHLFERRRGFAQTGNLIPKSAAKALQSDSSPGIPVDQVRKHLTRKLARSGQAPAAIRRATGAGKWVCLPSTR